jgi:hypothetical protein
MSIIDGNTKPLIAVDFDLTLCQSDYPRCGPAIPGGKEALQKFRDLGYLILIYSCRACHWHCDAYGVDKSIPTMEREHVRAMHDWLVEHEIPFDEIDTGTKGKPFARWYIDDRGISFNNNWAEIAAFVEARTKP